MKVCVSGTFNVLHKGHKKLIDKAFKTAGKTGIVYIGVTDDKMLKMKKFEKPFIERVKAIKDYLSSKRYNNRFFIKKIYNKYGPALDGKYDAIIVSPETIKNAQNLNIKRIKMKKKPLEIVEIPYVLAEDNKPISSTRILNKEIDENGRVL
jgi:pantetheine-phosphate adenylyltransferase